MADALDVDQILRAVEDAVRSNKFSDEDCRRYLGMSQADYLAMLDGNDPESVAIHALTENQQGAAALQALQEKRKGEAARNDARKAKAEELARGVREEYESLRAENPDGKVMKSYTDIAKKFKKSPRHVARILAALTAPNGHD